MKKGMRNDCREAPRVELNDVQSYHNGRRGEDYAYEGWKSNKYFTSDRFIKMNERHERLDGRPVAGWGYEIETECWGINNHSAYADVLQKIIFSMFPDDLFKLQHDSSLGVELEVDCYGNVETEQAIGVECITQIMTKQFIRNHYKDFKTMFDVYFRRFDISCDRSGNCGMHINVSNALFGDTREKQIEAIRKLHYFINKNYSFSCKLLNRDEDHTDYCEQMYYDDARTMEIYGGSHGTCMNYSHFDSGRIEIRLVGGQGDYYTFRNTSEVVFFLVDRMRTIKWDDLDDMTKVFKGCNQYVAKRLRYCDLPVDAYETIMNNVKEEDLELV